MSLSLSLEHFNSSLLHNRHNTMRRIPSQDDMISICLNDMPHDMSSNFEVSITQQEYMLIDQLMSQKEPYVSLRNKILNNPFKYYNPVYRKKLKKIDAELDVIDMKIYSLERDNYFLDFELEEIVNSFKEKPKTF
jgi:hypothetical protein